MFDSLRLPEERMKNLGWIILLIGFYQSMEIHLSVREGIPKNSLGEYWETALNTMTYHRNMMNEYLCRRYLANDIVDSLRNGSLNKRTGAPVDSVRFVRETMLEDPGSRKYKDWLSRSNTLEDIYRHYKGGSDGELHGSQTAPIGDGEVTGYALLGDKVAGLTDFNSGYGYHHYDHFEDDDEHEDKSVKLKEIFDLALTAIAFLAFGTFITETMMQGFGLQNQEAQMMIVSPMPGVNGISFKSNLEGIPLPNPEERSLDHDERLNILNEMSRHVLASIEAFSVAERDGGRCLRRALCEMNKFSRNLSGMQKIWLPLWSFATAWIAGKFVRADEYSLLENLKSSLFGFGNADCAKLYKKCDEKLGRRRK